MTLRRTHQIRLVKEMVRFMRGRHSYQVMRETIRVTHPDRERHAPGGADADHLTTYIVYRDGRRVGEGSILNELVSRVIRRAL